MVLRMIGGILVLIGLLFCFSIIGAFIGIPMMIVGGILCAVGGRRKTVITNVVQVSNAPGIPGNHFSSQEAQAPVRYLDREPSLMPPVLKELNPPRSTLDNPNRGYRAASTIEHDINEATGHSYDRAKWNALVEYDPDIGRIAAALKPFDQKYMDQFASAYLAINDKSYLAVIVQKVLASAKQDAARTR